MSWELRAGLWQESPPGDVDCCIADPPYDERTHANSKLEIRARETFSFGTVDPAEHVPAMLERARRWVICFCALEQLGEYRDAAGDAWVRAGIWVKTNPAPQFSGDRPAQGAEGIAIMHRSGKKQWNGGGSMAVWRWPTMASASEAKIHETQKPIGLMMRLVELFSEPDELIWDPFAGSGTTGVACLRLGRCFVGHEMDITYAEAARERLEAEAGRPRQTSILDLCR